MAQTSIKALADILGTSKTTINKYIKKLQLNPERVEINGQRFIWLNDDEVEQIRAEFNRKHPVNPTANDGAKGGGTTAKVGTNTAKGGGNDGGNLDFMIEQLKQKDKEIDRLHELLRQEQLLHARTQERLALLEQKDEPELDPPEPTEPPKGFFHRFFKGVDK